MIRSRRGHLICSIAIFFLLQDVKILGKDVKEIKDKLDEMDKKLDNIAWWQKLQGRVGVALFVAVIIIGVIILL